MERTGVLVDNALTDGREELALVDHEAPLVAAARLLRDSATNLVVVCDASGTMVGVITKTDVVSRISQCTGASCTMQVAGVMTREVVASRPG
jgi:CBS domain-containing protein